MPGLPDAEHRGRLLHDASPASTHTRFCCSAGPLVACPSARDARPDMTARAAIPIRASPAANIGLPHSAPPDGLTATPSPSPSADRSSSS